MPSFFNHDILSPYKKFSNFQKLSDKNELPQTGKTRRKSQPLSRSGVFEPAENVWTSSSSGVNYSPNIDDDIDNEYSLYSTSYGMENDTECCNSKNINNIRIQDVYKSRWPGKGRLRHCKSEHNINTTKPTNKKTHKTNTSRVIKGDVSGSHDNLNNLNHSSSSVDLNGKNNRRLSVDSNNNKRDASAAAENKSEASAAVEYKSEALSRRKSTSSCNLAVRRLFGRPLMFLAMFCLMLSTRQALCE